MSLLPPVEKGKLLVVEEGDSKGMEAIIEMLPTIKKVHVRRLIANEGYSVRKALEHVGVAICERQAKPRKVPEREEQEENEDAEE